MIRKNAHISPDGCYRYKLTRVWHAAGRRALFVMVNPSTADRERDDPTVRKCIAFARSWGCGSLEIANLFALRSPDPWRLRSHPLPVGPENDAYLISALRHAGIVVCAWGDHGAYQDRARAVFAEFLEPQRYGPPPTALAITRAGEPAHPLRLSLDLKPRAFTYDGIGRADFTRPDGATQP